MSQLNFLKTAHERAERLMDEQADLQRIDDRLNDNDQQFLQAHLSECEECRALQTARVEMQSILSSKSRPMASAGFVDRIMTAVEQGERPRADYEAQDRGSFRKLLMAGVAAAACVVLATQVSKSRSPAAEINAAGPVAAVAREAPDFTVRATDLGAAQVRRAIDELASRHDGRVANDGDGLRLTIPRAALVSVVQDLARKGRFKVSRTEDGELASDRMEVVLRIALD